ncbi:MAG TPA: VOC family protein [Kribbella sp.]|uniref:VOC family protein n=1 Tax=Kribbella sp. TaxID=1871183 RepID=UPI002D77E939|nr:VOC family protein [Kribbella sp.]HET6298767.1 VOC family protein [Kribbella sp.]
MTQVAEQPGTSAGRLGSVVLDCPDPLELARFYSTLFGLEIDEHGDDDWRSLSGPGSTLGFATLAFRRSEDYVPATWPGAEDNQLHLDLIVEDLASGHATVVALGAEPLDPVDAPPAQSARGWRVYADPAGHPFRICLE